MDDEVRPLYNATFTPTVTHTTRVYRLANNSYCHMEYDKGEANLAKLSIFNPNNVVVLFIRESVTVGQPVTSIEINISGKTDPEMIHQIKIIT